MNLAEGCSSRVALAAFRNLLRKKRLKYQRVKLFIPKFIRMACRTSNKDTKERGNKPCSVDLVDFGLRELAGAHTVEYPVFSIVRHKISPFQSWVPSPNMLGKCVETSRLSKTTKAISDVQETSGVAGPDWEMCFPIPNAVRDSLLPECVFRKKLKSRA